MKIALIGLGNMGSAIARRLCQAGFKVTVFNRTASKAEPFKALGATVANSTPEAVEEADIIMSCLFDDASVLATAETILSSPTKANIYISTETILPTTVQKLTKLFAQTRLQYASACCVGVPPTADRGELGVLFAGEKVLYEKLKPLFSTYSNDYRFIGSQPSLANVLKISTNYMLYSAIESMGEVNAFAEASGLDKSHLEHLFKKIYGTHPGFLLYADRITQNHFDHPNFSIAGGLKDCTLFQEAFRDQGVASPMIDIIKDHLQRSKKNPAIQNKDFSIFSSLSKLEE